MGRFDTYHPQYTSFISKWVRQRDVMGGEDAVKSRGVAYLPALDGQDAEYRMPDMTRVGDNGTVPTYLNHRVAQGTDTYESYLSRASFLNASKRTADGLVGAIMQKPPAIDYPVDTDLENCGVRGESFLEVVDAAVSAVLEIGRVGLLVDAQKGATDPYVAMYQAEDIVDWTEEVLDGRLVKTMVRLREVKQERDGEDGEYMTVVRYRDLRLGIIPTSFEGSVFETRSTEGAVIDVPDSARGKRIYYQEVWKVSDEDTGAANEQTQYQREVLEEVTVPRRLGGEPLDRIPFEIINPRTRTMAPDDPALQDLAVLNLSHYRNTADLEHGLHFTAIPQAWMSGFDFEDRGDLWVGGAAWISKQVGGVAGYLEFSGQGLGAIEKRMDVKRREMAMLGARMLEESPKQGAESESTVKLRRESDRSTLAKIASNISKALTEVLSIYAEWKNRAPGKRSVMLNEDYGTAGIDPQVLQALMTSVIEGTMSWNTYFWNLQRAGMFPPDVSEDQEIERIKESQSRMVGALASNKEEEAVSVDAGDTPPDPELEADAEEAA